MLCSGLALPLLPVFRQCIDQGLETLLHLTYISFQGDERMGLVPSPLLLLFEEFDQLSKGFDDVAPEGLNVRVACGKPIYNRYSGKRWLKKWWPTTGSALRPVDSKAGGVIGGTVSVYLFR